MPVGTLDDATLNSQGLNKPTPRARAKEPREPERVKAVVPVARVSDDEPIRMPNPIPDSEVSSESQKQEEPEQQEEQEILTPSNMYRLMFSETFREATKRVLTESEEGKALLDEIGVNNTSIIDTNQLSPWELECISQLRSSLSQFQEVEELGVSVSIQVNLPIQPFSFIVKR